MIWPTKKLGKDDAWKKGDILEGTDRQRKAAWHYIIALEDYRTGNFIGTMLTSKDTYPENISLKPEYIRMHSDEGLIFKIQYKNSHFVRGRFIKLESWGPFTKVGELTKEGIDFIDSETNGMQPELWKNYEARMRKR